MRVILIRHGDAVSSMVSFDDRARYLSDAGRRQAAATGQALAARGVTPSQVWCSPLVRAVQTAELIVATLGFEGAVAARDDLFPDSPIESLARALAQLDDDEQIVVVGHQPFMSAAASELLGCSVGGFVTGAACCLRVKGLFPHQAELEWRWPH